MNTGYPIRKSPGHSLSAASRGLSQLKHVLHRLLAPRHSPCALSNLFLDPIIFTALKQKKKKLISKPFSLKFCKIEPGQSSAKGSINKIADCSTQYTDVKEQVIPFRNQPTSYPVLRKVFAMVGLTGLEPVTPALSRRCSNQLSYRPDTIRGTRPTKKWWSHADSNR